jgi:hypothetical protein
VTIANKIAHVGAYLNHIFPGLQDKRFCCGNIIDMVLQVFHVAV